MSFYVHARHVRETARPLPHRLSAFGSCVQLYRLLIKRGHVETLKRFASAFDWQNPSGSGLLGAMDALETERRVFLQRLDAFARRRIRQKAHGRRRPAESEIESLYRSDFFVVQSPPDQSETRCHKYSCDLTGNVSGVCPECGTPVPGQVADAARAVPPMERNEQG